MRTRILRVLVPAIVLASVGFAHAGDIPEKKQTKLGLYVTAADAKKMIDNDHVPLIDIRSRAEVAFLGMPSDAAVNIPYMVMPMMAAYNAEKGDYDLEINPDFPVTFEAFAAEAGIGHDTPVILMCRSGSRSARAADLLADLGYTQVYTMLDGYEGDKVKDGPHKGQRMMNGWRNAGLGWSYGIPVEKAYPADR